jgi:hypothetical protein
MKHKVCNSMVVGSFEIKRNNCYLEDWIVGYFGNGSDGNIINELLNINRLSATGSIKQF